MAFNVGYRFVVFYVCCASMTIFVIQYRRGFLWLGIYSKFDGYRFTIFRNNPASLNSLKSNLVLSILEEKYKVGHAEGVDLFDPRTEEFKFHWPTKTRGHLKLKNLRERNNGKIEGVNVADRFKTM
ncbi:MAG TPA: hypothetical protein VK589_00935 [Chryseolinea sp.]|nr:hypothetical protein [Chryseolinea sp.]